ncbi:MAG: leucine-rich repeat protein [Lachnospiraceae bacterium]|nr:leucine-rich repeat protein [Lachnospiraceae bacterium]
MRKRRVVLKRIIAIIIALVLVLGDFPQGNLFSAWADELNEDNGDSSDVSGKDAPIVYKLGKGHVSEAGTLLATISGRTFTKVNDGDAVVGYMYNGTYSGPVVVSYESAEAVTYTTNYGNNVFNSIKTIEHMGRTWYVGSDQYWMYGNNASTAGAADRLSSTVFDTAVKELIDRSYIIYAGEAETVADMVLSGSIIQNSQNIVVSWSSLEGTSRYDVLRNGVKVASLGGEATQYCDYNTAASTSYEYSIIASDAEEMIIGRGSVISESTIAELVINSDYKLTSDMTVFSLTVNSRSLDLNGHVLNVCKNTTLKYNTLVSLNGGEFNNYGSFTIENGGRVQMNNANDTLNVNGDFNVYTYASEYYQGFTNGTIYLAGNLYASQGFYAAGSNAVIFNGSGLQNINILGNTRTFADVELMNTSKEGVNANAPINASSFILNNCKFTYGGEIVNQGYTLTEDVEITGDYILGAGTLDLNGHSLTVNGDFVQYGGMVYVDGGSLNVSGDYIIASRSMVNGAYSYDVSTGILKMTNANDRVQVGGSFITRSSNSHAGYLTAGIMEVKGDFYVYNNHDENFNASGTHTLKLSGEGAQKVYFQSSRKTYSYSRLQNVEITNETDKAVTFDTSSDVVIVTGNINDNGHEVGGYIDLGENATFTDNVYHGDLIISEGVYLNGTHTVTGNVYLNYSSNLYVKGKLTVEGNVESRDRYASFGTYGNGSIVHVNGNINLGKDYGYLYQWYGTIELEGNLTMTNTGSFSNDAKLVFCGAEKQTIKVPDTTHFITVEIANTSEEGVYSETVFAKDSLIITSGKLTYGSLAGEFGWTLTDDETYEGDLVLLDGVLDLNGHRLIVNGDLIQYAGTVKVGSGSLVVNGDYRIQERTENTDAATKETDPYKYSKSSGRLSMTNKDGRVLVNGGFYTMSNVSHAGYLTAGIMEVKGDFYVYNNHDENFNASGTHTLKLSGEGAQKVYFQSSRKTYSYSRLQNVEITNETDKAVTFDTSSDVVIVTGNINDNGHEVGGYIDLGENATFTDNVYHGDLIISEGVYLNGTHTVTGNVYLNYSSNLYVKGKLTVEGNVESRDRYASFGTYGNGSIVHVNGNINLGKDYGYLYQWYGTIELEGNLTMTNTGYFSNNAKIIFCGNKRQNVVIPEETNFITVETKNESNEGVHFSGAVKCTELIRNGNKVFFGSDNAVYGWTLTEDETVEDTLILGDGELNLNGHTLVIKGDLIHVGGDIKVNGGSLIVEGNYSMLLYDEASATVTNKASLGNLIMQSADDSVIINGNWNVNSVDSMAADIVNGRIEVKGNIVQYGSNPITMSGDSTLVLSGLEKQSISGSLVSVFANVVNNNLSGLTLSTAITVTKSMADNGKKVTGTVNVSKLSILNEGSFSGNVVLNAVNSYSGDLTIDGTLTIDKALTLGEGVINVSSLTVNDKLDTGKSSIYCSGNMVVQNNGLLIMTESNAYVRVIGNFSMTSYNNHSGYLTDGVLELRGNFSQANYTNFIATKNHQTVLAKKLVGNRTYVQQITFSNNAGTTRFNKLILKKIDDYYKFSPEAKKIANEIIKDIVDDEAPTQVTGLIASDVTAAKITLNFDASTDNIAISAYAIYRDGVKVNQSSTTEYVDKNLEPDKEYAYVIYAFDNEGNYSEPSDALKVKTLKDTEAPAAVSDLSLYTRTGKSLTLSWKPSVDNVGVVGYTLYKNGSVLAENLTGTSYKDSDVEVGKAYSYTVLAHDKSGNVSSAGNVVETSVALPEFVYVSPDDKSEYGSDSIEIVARFKNVGNSTGNTVKLEYYDGESWKSVTKNALNQKAYNSSTLYVSYNWDIRTLELPENVKIKYTLTDSEGSTAVKTVSFKLDRVAPAVPAQFKGLSVNSTVKLEWVPSISADCTGYRVYRKLSTDAKYELITSINNGKQSMYTDSSVEENREYSYQIEAFDKFNNTSEKATVVVTTDVDKEAPVVTAILPSTVRVNGLINLNVEAKDNREVARVYLQIREEEADSWTDLGSAEYINGKAVYGFDSTSVSDGIYLINAYAEDVSGNKSTVEFTRRYEIDNTGIAKLDIKASEITAVSVRLDWNDATETDFAYFLVEKYNGTEFTELTKVTNKLGYYAVGLKPDTEYSFRVVGYDNLGNRGIPSEAVTITTVDDVTAPAITAIGPAKSYYKDSLNLYVSAVDDHEIAKAVFSASRDGVSFEEIATVIAENASTSNTLRYTYDITSLAEGDLFIKYEVYDKAGNKNVLTNEGEEIIGQVIIDRTAPHQVTGLKVLSDDGYVQLGWDDATKKDSDIRGFKIYRADANTGSYKVICAETNTINYIDNNVTRGKDYLYMVAAIDIAGNVGEQSTAVNASIKADTDKPLVSCIYPISGSTLGQNPKIEAGVQDKNALKSVFFEYSTAEDPDIWVTIDTVNTSERVLLAGVNWNTEGLSDGEYNVRVYAIDVAGNTSDVFTASYQLDVTAPAKPVIKAETDHMKINLTITCDKSGDFDHYEIYRKKVGESEVKLLDIKTETYSDESVDSNVSYSYRVAAVDINGNKSWSETVQAYADDVDVIAPVAVLGDVITGVVGREVRFDGTASTDNKRIVSYEWLIDGSVALSGATCTYIFNTAGSHSVKLTVSDEAGNSASANAQVMIYEQKSSGSASIHVTDAYGSGLGGAYIYFKKSDGEVYSAVTDAFGYIEVSGMAGTYNIAAYKNGYLPADIDANLSQYEQNNYQISLKKDDLIVGELTVRRMTLEEMEKAGVDFSNPANYDKLVFNLSVKLEKDTFFYDFVVGRNESVTKPVSGSHGGHSSITVTNVSPKPDLPVIIYVNTTQTVSWLKEMYEVQLGVLNQADSQYVIQNSVARLNLPSGLSLAALSNRKQSLTVGMGSIAGQQKKYTTWIVKGDENGEYQLTADFLGTLMPFNAPVSAHFVANTSIEVLGGEGLHIYVMPASSLRIGEKYKIRYAIVNESKDRSFYNLSFEMRDTDGSVEVDFEETAEDVYGYSSCDGKTVAIKELAPGKALYATYTTETVISNVNVSYPEDLIYYNLVQKSIQTLEGKNLGVKVTFGQYPKPVKFRVDGEIDEEWGHIKWWIDGSTLYVEGTGDYLNPDATSSWKSAPWCQYAGHISKAIVDLKDTTVAYKMFEGCNALRSVDFSKFTTSKIKTMYAMFKDCSLLSSIDMSTLYSYQLTNCEAMFSGCSKLKSVDFKGFTMTNVENVMSMFLNCSSLEEIDMSTLNCKKVSKTVRMLEGCDSLNKVVSPKSTGTGNISLPVESNTDNAWFIENGTKKTYVKQIVSGQTQSHVYVRNSIRMKYGSDYGQKAMSFAYRTYDDNLASYDYSIDFNDFFKSSYNYQHSLIKASIRTAISAFDISSISSLDGFYNIKKLMTDLDFDVNSLKFQYPAPSYNSIGYAIGNRKIINSSTGKESTLILVAIRGGGYGVEWGGNFNVGDNSSTNHDGFNDAANQVLLALNKYISTYKEEFSEEVKFWVVGYSRGGATTNLICSKIINGRIDAFDVSSEDVFGFCFECPRTTTAPACSAKKYNGIKCIVNPIDFVPLVPMNNGASWLFERYGITYTTTSLNDPNYSSKYMSMVSQYLNIVKAQPMHTTDYTSAVAKNIRERIGDFNSQEDYNKNVFINMANNVVDRDTYVSKLQDSMIVAMGEFLGNNKAIDLSSWGSILLNKKYFKNTKVVKWAISDMEVIQCGHFPELCLAWIDSQTQLGSYTYTIGTVKCPVDVKVYDEDDKLVAYIKDNVSQEIEGGLITRVEDDKKIIIMPTEKTYRFEMKAYDDGKVNFSCTTVTDPDGVVTNHIVYPEVDVKVGDVLTSYVCANEKTNADGISEVVLSCNYKNDDVETISPVLAQSGENIERYFVNVDANDFEMGEVTGQDYYLYGNICSISAIANEGYEFVAWEQNGAVISTDETYRINVKGDMKVTAKFRKIDEKTPTVTPEVTDAPTSTPGGTTPTVTPGVTDAPTSTPGGTTPTVTPGVTDAPTSTPGGTTPTVTPGVTNVPTATPTVTPGVIVTPAVTPTQEPADESGSGKNDNTVTGTPAQPDNNQDDKENSSTDAPEKIVIKVGNKFVGADGNTYKFVSVKGKDGAKVNAVSLVELKKQTSKVVIPDTVKLNGKTFRVTSIGSKVFRKNTKLTSVVLGKYITELANYQFSGCVNLKKVTLNANLISIGKYAFNKCKKLTGITLPSKLTVVSGKAFAGCSAINKIVINSTKLKTSNVGSKVFSSISKNAKIYVPEKMFKKYTEMLRNSGVPKTVKISSIKKK